jgi:hypothetical protein
MSSHSAIQQFNHTPFVYYAEPKFLGFMHQEESERRLLGSLASATYLPSWDLKVTSSDTCFSMRDCPTSVMDRGVYVCKAAFGGCLS